MVYDTRLHCLDTSHLHPRSHHSFVKYTTRLRHSAAFVCLRLWRVGRHYVESHILLQKQVISPLSKETFDSINAGNPLYDVTKETVTPSVEFVWGIPPDL